MKRLTLILLVTALVLSCSKNTPPVIVSLIAEPDSVYLGDTLTITYKTSDADGDAILYLFSKSAGTWITDIGTGQPARWIAPKVPGDYYLTLTISDLTDKVVDSAKIHVMDTTGVFTDARDGHQYKWVKIGSQIWMAENLAFLPTISPPSQGSETSPFIYVHEFYGYNTDSAAASLGYHNYGALYNWAATNGICPAGWHLPSMDEYVIASDRYGETYERNMKSTSGWIDQMNGDNISGFNALPAGARYPDPTRLSGKFYPAGTIALFWTSTPYDGIIQYSEEYSWVLRLSAHGSGVGSLPYVERDLGLSVRCVKD